MAKFIHFDEANTAAIHITRKWLSQTRNVDALLLTDLFGKLRILVNPEAETDGLTQELGQICGLWWTGEVVQMGHLDEIGREIYARAWESARVDEHEHRLKLLNRHRSRTAWFVGPVDPPWLAPEAGPPIIVFYSFKGGLGRSTLLAAFAVQRARAGERVCVIDMDLDSPGVGRLLSADKEGLTAQWGVVDFLLEHRLPNLSFEDYWHRCDRVAGDGEIRVMPSGKLDTLFASKLARVDLEEAPTAHESGIWNLLQLTREELAPDWILLDARTGISEPAGQLLSGISHLHVLLGTFQEQSWQGLDQILDRLGRDRILVDLPQADVLLVQAMVPIGEPGKWAKEIFAGRAENAFEDRYYADSDSDPDIFWTVNDKQGEDAPHMPAPVHYDASLAGFADIEDVADRLASGDYTEVGTRISNRFVKRENI
jgi:hypothetical protein